MIAIQFTSAGRMQAFYDRRVAVALHNMENKPVPSQCPVVGRWYPGADGPTSDEALAFSFAKGARVDWSGRDSTTYFIGVGAAAELDELCSWWNGLDPR
jgi:hypothetical protein